MSLFNLSLVLFLIMDPIGNISSFQSLMTELEPKRQNWIIFREMMIVLFIMLAFNMLGEILFKLFGLSETTVLLASGVILFLIAIKILFTTQDNVRANLPKGEPFLFPIAVPLIAGPALLATVLLYANLKQSQHDMFFAILIAWLFSIFILLVSRPISRLLGNSGLSALERLIGMVLVLIAVQRFLEGISSFWKAHF